MNTFARELMALVWAMRPEDLQVLLSRVGSITQAELDHKIRAIIEKGDLLERIHEANGGSAAVNSKRRKADVSEDGLDIRGGVAHIQIAGPMMKQVPSIMNWLGIKATSTEAAREELAAAVESDRVESIVLDIDSPGGTVDGTAALAEDVYAVRGLKPIKAVVPDLMASAAMWVGAQAERIEIGPSASVGSIGVYAVVDDRHQQYEKAGIQTHVISSHELKGAFVEGAQVTKAQLADMQRNIDTYTELFIDAVGRGRAMPDEDVRGLATGQMWIGVEALEMGLVDQVNAGENAYVAGGRSVAADISTPYGNAVEIPRAEIDIVAPLIEAIGLHQETNAEPSALTEEEMEAKERQELERLRAENAAQKDEIEKAQADAEAARVRLEAESVAKREALLGQYADRVHPAMADSVSKVVHAAESHEVAEQYLKDLPQVTRPERESVVPPDRDLRGLGIDPAIVRQHGHKFLTGDAKVAAFMRMPEERMNRIDDLVAGAYSDGTFQLKDGRVVDKDELKALLG